MTGTAPRSGWTKAWTAGWHLLGATQAEGSLSTSSWLAGLSGATAYPVGSTTSTTTIAFGTCYWVNAPGGGTWTPPGGTDGVTTFTYDGDGGRVKQTTSAGTTTYLGEVYEKTGSTTTKYVFAGGQRIASKDSTGALRFYHPDHLGSSNVITDSAGALVELAEHLPFGALARREVASSLQPSASSRIGYTGQREVPSTGLIHFPARAYDPSLGRFLQPDPFVQDPTDPQTLNRYAYVRNNPVNLVDPTGYFSFKKFFAIVASVVVAAFTGQVELPFLVAAAFSTAVVAAAAAEGAAIDRALQRSNQNSTASSSPQPSVLQQLNQQWFQFATQPGVARGASFVSGFVPGAGEAQDYAGFRYGIDLITQERLGSWDRAFSGAMLFLPFVGATSVRHSVRALNSVVEESTGRLLKAYRVVGEEEAEVIRRTGRIPNTTRFGKPKEVLLSPTKYTSSKQAEEALRVGKLDPRGPHPSPKYGVEADLEGVPLSRANMIEGGTDFEVGTYGSPHVRRMFKLDE